MRGGGDRREHLLATLAPISPRPDTTRTGQGASLRETLDSADGQGGDGDRDQRERAMVGRARAGDRNALEDLLRGQYERVYAVCRRMTGNDSDAADAAQEALLAVVRGLPHFDERSRFSTWVYRVAMNCSIDELRRRARRRAVSLDAGPTEAGAFLSTGDRGGEADPESAADRVDVDRALRRLPPEFRAAVVLRDLCRLDYAEIAEVLEVPGGTVRSRIARGRGLLVGLLAATREES